MALEAMGSVSLRFMRDLSIPAGMVRPGRPMLESGACAGQLEGGGAKKLAALERSNDLRDRRASAPGLVAATIGAYDVDPGGTAAIAPEESAGRAGRLLVQLGEQELAGTVDCDEQWGFPSSVRTRRPSLWLTVYSKLYSLRRFVIFAYQDALLIYNEGSGRTVYRPPFIATLMDDPKLDLRVASMPYADKFQLHIYAALAEQEREFISRRTKAALAGVMAPHDRAAASQRRGNAGGLRWMGAAARQRGVGGPVCRQMPPSSAGGAHHSAAGVRGSALDRRPCAIQRAHAGVSLASTSAS